MMRKLKSLFMVLFARGYYVVSDKGTMFDLPNDSRVLEALLFELDNLDSVVEEALQEIRLSEY